LDQAEIVIVAFFCRSWKGWMRGSVFWWRK